MQKTAYEMRISDWSSDVCSSDLTPDTPRRRYAPNTPRHITRNENPSPHDLLQRLPLRQFVDQLVHVPRLPDKRILDFFHAHATNHAFDQRAVWMTLRSLGKECLKDRTRVVWGKRV